MDHTIHGLSARLLNPQTQAARPIRCVRARHAQTILAQEKITLPLYTHQLYTMDACYVRVSTWRSEACPLLTLTYQLSRSPNTHS